MTNDPPSNRTQKPGHGIADFLYHEGERLARAEQPREALGWFRRAADTGHPEAALAAGRVLLFLGTDADEWQEAIERLLAAEQAGQAAASYLLAQVALGGHLLPRDFLAIDQRLLAAARAGFAPAQRALGLIFGRDPDPRAQEAARQLFADAAAAGDPISAYLLAERLHYGEGGPADPVAAETLHAQLVGAGRAALPRLPRATLSDCGGASDAPIVLSAQAMLALPEATEHHAKPRVRTLPGLFGVEECRFVIAMSSPHLRRSQVFDPNSDAAIAHPIRNSSDASFDPLLEDFSLRLLQLRMARAAGCELPQGEQLIVLRYQPGEHYLPHRDYLGPSALAANRPDAGQRLCTVCVNLHPVELGGETEFPLLDLKLPAAMGSAVVFDNLHADGRLDPNSLHAGLAVERGEKWLATLWFREHSYRAF